MQIASPRDFFDQLFYRVLIEGVNENRIAFLKTMTWCYAQYQHEIGELNFIENTIYLLQRYNR